METLLQYLREHLEATFPMEDRPGDSRAEEGLQAKPLRKYVSVFRINGEPIIPPLMTTDKIRQMHYLKEKAIKVEKRLKERRSSHTGINISLDKASDAFRSSVCNQTDNISHRSQDYYDSKLKESEESIMLLRDILKRQSICYDLQEQGSSKIENSSNSVSNTDKLKKLQKTETLIYDNTKNEVVKQITIEKEEPNLVQDKPLSLQELERMANLNYLQPKKPSQLLLAGINDKGGVSIPSICLNPPTPLVGTRKLCEPIEGSESSDMSASDVPSQALYLTDDVSSDESFTSMLTHNDVRCTQVMERLNGLPRSGRIHDLKAFNTPSNVSSKIQKFENISSENSSCNSSPLSSPHKTISGRSKQQICSTSLSRSATSPSINLSVFPTCSQASSECVGDPPDNGLVRSSSFTLEAPSKALMDHMRKQKACYIASPAGEVKQTLQPNRKTSFSPSRVHRDTIESKAKRVQKLEPKTSHQKIQQKPPQPKFVNSTASSMSSLNPSSIATFNSTRNLYKTKKSPYDIPNSSRCFGNRNSSSAVRRSPTTSASSVPNQKLSKSKSGGTVKPTTSSFPLSKAPSTEKEVLSQMDKIQKEKFLTLLKQQDEEQKKLKQAFEAQQKLLIEQMNKEVKITQSDHNLATASTSKHRSGLENSQHFRFPIDSTQNRQYQADGNIAGNLQPTVTRNICENTKITENSCDYSLVPSLPLSNLSSLDNSNVNTSFDSSSATVSNQVSHRKDTLHNESTKTPKQNGYVTVGSGHVSSRRRLFPQDHVSSMSPNQRDLLACSSPSSSIHRVNDASYQLHHYQSCTNAQKACVGLENSTQSRHLVYDDDVAHAAATTINAYVRGFLTRRLFKTEQIQRIVQTIHDTLIFVLNLHLETCENPAEGNSAENIKLKARLLQQLSSATHTMHLVFFQTSVKDRMDIIARDRKRLRTKLLAMKRQRTPRIAG